MAEYTNDKRPVGYQELAYYHQKMKAYVDAIDADASHVGHTHTSDEIYDEGYVKRFTNPYDIRRLANINNLLTYTSLYGILDVDVDSYGTYFLNLMGNTTVRFTSTNNNDNMDSKRDPEIEATKYFARRLDFFVLGNGYTIEWPENVSWIIGSNKFDTDVATYITMVTNDNGEHWLASNMSYAGENIDITIEGCGIASDAEVQEMLDEVFDGVEPSPDPVSLASGTLVIVGDLTADISIIGNIQVNGSIYDCNVSATGQISCSNSEGATISEGSDNTSDINFSVVDGTLTITSNVSNSEDGGIYTTGSVINAEGTTTVIYDSFTIEAAAQNALYNNNGTLRIDSDCILTASSSYSTGRGIYNNGGKLIIEKGATVELHGTGSSGRGLYNYNDGEFINNGDLTAEGTAYGIYTNGTLTINNPTYATAGNIGVRVGGGTVNGTSILYDNGEVFYDGTK